MKKIINLFLVFFIVSCVPNWYKPMGYKVFSQMPKGGSPGYNLGWIHGCQSGLGSQFGGAIYMSFYTWSRDPDITSSKPNIPLIKDRYKKELKDVNWNDPADIKRNFADYNMVFWDAHYFCRQTVLGTLQAAEMRPPLPGQDRWLGDDAFSSKYGADNIGSVWRINGKGDTRWATGYW